MRSLAFDTPANTFRSWRRSTFARSGNSLGLFARRRSMKLLSIFGFLCLLVVLPLAAAAQTFDLAADWSDTANPNGVWSYNGTPGTPLAPHQPDWDSIDSFWSSPQPAWAAAAYPNAGHIPMWAKGASATSALDWPAGVVGMHAVDSAPGVATGVTWTSPIDGTIDISGGVWFMDHPAGAGRSMDWSLLANGSLLTQGTISSGDAFDSSTPFDLGAGNGGRSVLQRAVSVRDVITLQFERSAGSQFPFFAGVRLAITALPNLPEPGPDEGAALCAATGAGATFFDTCVTTHANLIRLISPQGSGDHIHEEGYAICSNGGATVHGYDASVVDAGFSAPTTATGSKNVRTTTDGKFRLTQNFTRTPNAAEVEVKMTLRNISRAPISDVQISRYVSFDINEARVKSAVATEDSVAAVNVNGLMLSADTLDQGVPHFTEIEAFDPWRTSRTGCEALSPLASPAGPDNLTGRLTYNLGTMAPGATSVVRVVYKRF